MKRTWILSLVCCVGCADVIGADFGGKTLDLANDNNGGEAGAFGDGGASDDTGGTHAGGSGGGSSGGKGSGGASSGGTHTGGSVNSGGADTGGSGGATTGGSGGSPTGGASTGGAATGGGGTGGAATGGGSGSGGAATGGASSGGSGGNSDSLVINEVYAEGSLDFIELYNTGSSSINLAGYQLANGIGAPSASDRITLSGSIGAGKYYVEAESCILVICDYFPFDIDTAGDTLWLLDGSGNVVDSVDYPDTDAAGGLDNGESYSRLPNGSGSFAAGEPTKGSSNTAP